MPRCVMLKAGTVTPLASGNAQVRVELIVWDRLLETGVGDLASDHLVSPSLLTARQLPR